MRATFSGSVIGFASTLLAIYGISQFEYPVRVYNLSDEVSGKSVELKMSGKFHELPYIDKVNVTLKQTTSAVVPVLPLAASMIGFTLGCAIISAGISKCDKEFPYWIANKKASYEEANRMLKQQQLDATIDSEISLQSSLETAPQSQIEAIENARTHTQKALTVAQEIEILDFETQRANKQLELAQTQKKLQKLLGQSGTEPAKVDSLEVGKATEKKLVKWFLKKARKHESGWLEMLITGSKPLIVSGGQGANKSSLVTALAMLQHFNDGRNIENILDTHAHKNMKKWGMIKEICPDVKICGAKGDWESYARAFYLYAENCVTSEHIEGMAANACLGSFIADEMTNFKTYHGKEREEIYRQSLTDLLTAARKAFKQIILISHNITNSTIPTGLHDMVREACNILKLSTNKAQLSTGKGYFLVMGVDGEEKEPITIPAWLSHEGISESFKRGRPVKAIFTITADKKEEVTFEEIDDSDWEESEEDI